MKDSIFVEEWRECLRSHYLHVVRTNDEVTEPTLRDVLIKAGVDHDMIEEWREQGIKLRDSQ